MSVIQNSSEQALSNSNSTSRTDCQSAHSAFLSPAARLIDFIALSPHITHGEGAGGGGGGGRQHLSMVTEHVCWQCSSSSNDFPSSISCRNPLQYAVIPNAISAHVLMPCLFMKQVGLSEGDKFGHCSHGSEEDSVSRRRSDELEETAMAEGGVKGGGGGGCSAMRPSKQ